MVGTALLTANIATPVHALTVAPSPPEDRRSRCVIVGAGIVGLTTAYFLSLTGRYELHVIDSHSECSMGASFQNGGVINVESIFPVNSYLKIGVTMQRSLMSTLTGSNTNTLITPQVLYEQTRLYWIYFLFKEPALVKWLYYFFLNRPEPAIKKNSRTMLQIGAATGELFNAVARDIGLNHKHNFCQTPGLCLFHVDDPQSFVERKQAMYDGIHKKTYLRGDELQRIMTTTVNMNCTSAL